MNDRKKNKMLHRRLPSYRNILPHPLTICCVRLVMTKEVHFRLETKPAQSIYRARLLTARGGGALFSGDPLLVTSPSRSSTYSFCQLHSKPHPFAIPSPSPIHPGT